MGKRAILSENQIRGSIIDGLESTHNALRVSDFATVILTDRQKEIFKNGALATAGAESTFGANISHAKPQDHGIMGLNEINLQYFVLCPAFKAKLRDDNKMVKERTKITAAEKEFIIEYLEKDETLNIKIGIWFYGQKFYEIIRYPKLNNPSRRKDWENRFGDHALALSSYSLYTQNTILSESADQIIGYKRNYNLLLTTPAF
jgi:hypothetical protein